jgi:hypothetical protein
MTTVREQSLPEHKMDDPKPEEKGEANRPSPSVSKAFVNCLCYGSDGGKRRNSNSWSNSWDRRYGWRWEGRKDQFHLEEPLE